MQRRGNDEVAVQFLTCQLLFGRRVLSLLLRCITMAPLSTLVLPLPPHAPPSGYGWSDRALSTLSTTTAFYIGLDQRDQFLGQCRCVICGIYGSGTIDHCQVIMDSEPDTVSQNGIWNLLRLMWDTVERPQAPPLDPWGGQSCTPSWPARWHPYV